MINILLMRSVIKIGLIPIVCLVMNIQCLAQQGESAAIERAMKDELKRSMEELSQENHEKPFFISYRINDSKVLSITATLGALIQSVNTPVRTKSVRVIVGDYDFNDESLTRSSSQGGETGIEIELPLDDDYYGIRRALWASTDGIYKSASKKLKENLNYIKEQGKDISTTPHKSFASAPVVHISKDAIPFTLDKVKLETLAREVSGLLKQYQEIEASNVSINCVHGFSYFLNSEGTSIKLPLHQTSFRVSATTRSDDGELIYDEVTYHTLTPDKLPEINSIKKEVTVMLDNLLHLRKAEIFKDSYTGPVLFVGKPVETLLTNNLFSYREGLIASNNVNDQQYTSTGALDSKLGKKVIDERFTIKAIPGLNTFEGIELLGTFDVDDEGVVPPHELTLIEKGILKELLHDRTIVNNEQKPNGFGSNPGVVNIFFTGGTSLEELKKKLIEKAKEEDTGYAIMVKSLLSGSSHSINTYKVHFDGKEELLRSTDLNSIKLKSLRKVMGATSKQIAFNTRNYGTRGVSSFIVPQALLLEEIEIEGIRAPVEKEISYVPSPLKDY